MSKLDLTTDTLEEIYIKMKPPYPDAPPIAKGVPETSRNRRG